MLVTEPMLVEKQLDQLTILKHTFHENLFLFQSDETINNKNDLFKVISEKIAECNTHLTKNTVLYALQNREKIGHTAITTDVAIPHARLTYLSSPIGSVTKLKKPIKYSNQQHYISLIFTLVVPMQATEKHLSILSTLASRLSRPTINQLLLLAKNEKELYQAFFNP